MVSDPVNWWDEARIAVIVATFAALLGSVVGVVWHALAPRVDIVAFGANKLGRSGFKPMIGDDLWLGLIGVIAAIACVAGVILVSPEASRGPGATFGLALGGFLGMLVAARVGHLIGHSDFYSALRGAYPDAPIGGLKSFLGRYDFSVRWKGALFSWPIVAVVLHAAIVGGRAANEPTRRMVSAYPGSS